MLSERFNTRVKSNPAIVNIPSSAQYLSSAMNSKEDQAVFKAQINDAKQVKATPTKDGDQSEQKVNNSEQSSPFDDYYPTVEEVSENFNRVQEAIVEYEDGNVKLPYTDAVRILKRLEQSVMYHSMFSPNEDVSEVATEHLKYLLS